MGLRPPDAPDPGAVRAPARPTRTSVDELFGPKFLLERPLLDAVRAGDRAVLLIDEVDRADDEFEAFLLELLSDFQITIPEIGTIRAEQPPLVVLTSNRTRELHDALKRRCLYHWVGYPERRARGGDRAGPGARRLRDAGPQGGRRGQPAARAWTWPSRRASPRPSTGSAPSRCSAPSDLDADAVDDTLGAVVKDRDDLELVRATSSGIAVGCLSERRPLRRACWSTSPRELRADGLRGRLRRRADLLRGDGAARPDRPARPLLGRPHHAGHPPRPDPGLRPGVPAVLPRRAATTLPEPSKFTVQARGRARSALQVPGDRARPARSARSRRPARPGRLRRADVLRNKAFAACTPEELAALRRIMRTHAAHSAAAPDPAHGAGAGAAGSRPAPHGARDDAHARRAGAAATGARRRLRHRPLVLILDVSGSMADYSRNLLQFALPRPRGVERGSRCSASAPG